MSYRKKFYLEDGTPAVVLQSSDNVQVWSLKKDDINAGLEVNLACLNPKDVDVDTFIRDLNAIWTSKKQEFDKVFSIFDKKENTENAVVVEPKQINERILL